MEFKKSNLAAISIVLIIGVALMYEKGIHINFQVDSKTLYHLDNSSLGSTNFPKTPKVQNKHISGMLTVSISNREILYEHRRQVVKLGCEELRNITGEQSTVSRLLVDPVHSIYYCPITKVGSTFWKRILTVISSKGRLNSPYDIGLGGVRLKKKNIGRHTLTRNWKRKESFLFVRDPYARLFSGYENKIYHPNRRFWRSVGSKIVNKYRNVTHKVKYGYDVTFPEFVRAILDDHEHDHKINGHFTLMSEHCNPCQIDFKYIGNLETIADDTEYLLTRWRHKFSDVTLKFDNLHKKAGLDTARGHVRSLFQIRSLLRKTFPFRAMMLRTWRDLQMRGYISKHTEFPYVGSVSNVTRQDFMRQIKDTISKAENRTALKLQRHEALVQAYSQVPLEDMDRLRQYLLPDCILFGYDDRPMALFNRSNPVDDDFLYLDGLTSDTKNKKNYTNSIRY